VVPIFGKFILPKTSCAYRQTVALAVCPNDYKEPGKLILEVLALRTQGLDAKNATPVNRSSHGEAAA
jgi:hypothetical protein